MTITSKEDAIFKQIATIIANTRQIERKKRLSLRLLTDLYKVIKYNDYDEDRLAEVLLPPASLSLFMSDDTTTGGEDALKRGFYALPSTQ